MSWKCFLISNGTPCADDDVVVGMGGIDGFAGSESVCVCVFAAVCQTGFRVVRWILSDMHSVGSPNSAAPRHDGVKNSAVCFLRTLACIFK